MARGAQTTIAIGVQAKDANAKLKSLTGEFQQSAQQIKSGFADKLSGALGRIHPELGRLGSVLGKAGPVALGLTAIAAGTVGVVAAFNRWSEATDRIAKQSTRLGVTESQLIGLRHAADQSGVSIQSMEMALTKLQKRSVMAAEGNKELARGFEAAGINLDTFLQLSPNEKMLRLADALSDVEDPSERVRRSMQLLGDEAGVKMITMLEGGSEALLAFQQEALDLGIGLDSKTTAQTQSFRDELDKAGKALAGVANQFMIALAPAMEQIGRMLAWLAKGFNTIIRPMSDALNWLISWDREQATIQDVARQNSEQFNSKTKADLEKEAELRKKVAEAARKQREELEKFSAPTVAKMFEEAAAVTGDLSFIRDAQVAKALELEAKEVERRIKKLQSASTEEKQRARMVAALLGIDPSAVSDEAIEQEISSLGQRLGFLLRNQRAKFEQAQAALEAAGDGDGKPKRRRKRDGRPAVADVVNDLEAENLSEMFANYRERQRLQSEVLANEERFAEELRAFEERQAEEQRRGSLSFAQRLREDFDAALLVIQQKGGSVMDGLKAVSTGGLQIFHGLGGAMGQAFQAAFSGGDFGKALMQAVGQQLTALGTMLIQVGTASLLLSPLSAIPFFGALAGPPGLAAGAGAALIAGGVAMTAIGGAMGAAAGPGGGAGGGRSGASGGASSPPRRRASEPRRVGPDFGRGRDGEMAPAPVVINFNGATNSRRTRRELEEVLAS